MVKALHIVVLASAATLSSGCALTAYGPEMNTTFTYRNQIRRGGIKDLYPEENSSVRISTSCVGFLPYTGMMSPIVPLPPIIPLRFSSPKAFITMYVDTARADATGSYLKVKQKGAEYTVRTQDQVRILNGYRSSEFRIQGSCNDIAGTEVRVFGILVRGQPRDSEPLTINVDPRNKFAFGYLSGGYSRASDDD